MENMKKLNSKEVNILRGKIYFFDRNLYGQIEISLANWMKYQSMLEEVDDKIITAYLKEKKGEVLDDILCYTNKSNYPDYPKMED